MFVIKRNWSYQDWVNFLPKKVWIVRCKRKIKGHIDKKKINKGVYQDIAFYLYKFRVFKVYGNSPKQFHSKSLKTLFISFELP